MASSKRVLSTTSCPLTGNSNIANQTGRTYFLQNMTKDVVLIPTANLGFRPRRDRRMCSQAVSLSTKRPATGNNQQTGNAAAAKPEILIPLKLLQTALRFQLQIWNIRPRNVRKSVGKWLQQRPTTGNSDMAPKTGTT